MGIIRLPFPLRRRAAAPEKIGMWSLSFRFPEVYNNAVILAILFTVWGVSAGRAWDRGTVAYEKGCGVTVEPVLPADSTHLLDWRAGGPLIKLSLRNTSNRAVSGAFLYLGITDFAGAGVRDFESRVNLGAGEEKSLEFEAGSLEVRPGFYDVRVLLFDHGRELGYKEFSFGYAVSRLEAGVPRPPDFDRFWKATLDSLSRVEPAPAAVKDTLRSSDAVAVYRVSFASLHGVRVHGWFTLPAGRPGPFPALLFLPGYSTGRISPATGFSELGYATLSIQVRGYEVDQESYPEDNGSYMAIGVEAPETYVYREIVCHCLRSVDFLCGRPEIDRTAIGTVGGSQGGGLALLAAGLDRRVRAVVAGVPFLTDFPLSLTMTGNPYRELARYLESRPGSRERVLRTVGFFDTVSLAERIEVPVLISLGLFDRTCPAPAIYGMYQRLAARDKKIEIYPYLDHLEVWQRFAPTVREWLLKHLPPVKEGR